MKSALAFEGQWWVANEPAIKARFAIGSRKPGRGPERRVNSQKIGEFAVR